VIRNVNNPWIGTLPDFGNFPPEVDRFAALKILARSGGRAAVEGVAADTELLLPDASKKALAEGMKVFR